MLSPRSPGLCSAPGAEQPSPIWIIVCTSPISLPLISFALPLPPVAEAGRCTTSPSEPHPSGPHQPGRSLFLAPFSNLCSSACTLPWRTCMPPTAPQHPCHPLCLPPLLYHPASPLFRPPPPRSTLQSPTDAMAARGAASATKPLVSIPQSVPVCSRALQALWPPVTKKLLEKNICWYKWWVGRGSGGKPKAGVTFWS